MLAFGLAFGRVFVMFFLNVPVELQKNRGIGLLPGVLRAFPKASKAVLF